MKSAAILLIHPGLRRCSRLGQYSWNELWLDFDHRSEDVSTARRMLRVGLINGRRYWPSPNFAESFRYPAPADDFARSASLVRVPFSFSAEPCTVPLLRRLVSSGTQWQVLTNFSRESHSHNSLSVVEYDHRGHSFYNRSSSGVSVLIWLEMYFNRGTSADLGCRHYQKQTGGAYAKPRDHFTLLENHRARLPNRIRCRFRRLDVTDRDA